METTILRTLHPAPARADLITVEYRLQQMDARIRQLEQEKAEFLDRLQASEQRNQLTAVQIQQVIQSDAALAARTDQLERDKAALSEQLQSAVQANQALADQLQALTQRAAALEKALQSRPAGKAKAAPKAEYTVPKTSVSENRCGPGCTWSLDGGVLTILGSGKMDDYGVASSVPWAKHRATITAVVLPEGLTSIGSMAFSYCDKLRNIHLPSTLSSIGKSAFWRCTSLTEITLPDGLYAIGKSAFWRCTSLARIQIPSSVSTLDSDAFLGCTALRWISFLGGAPRFIGQRVFDEVTATVYYPGNDSSWNMGIQSRCGGKLTWKPSAS
ncbi:MAG: leucine-rich repeat protein [Candidatus Onthomonas sp.]